jgi:DNA-binding PadR family transcriptional regulator
MASIRMTHTTALILRALAEGHRHGFEIMEVSGLPSGTVYPALRRLEREGALSSAWEPAPGTGPRRRVYALTASGEAMARVADERLREARRFLAGDLRPGEVGPLGGGSGRP